MGRKKILTIFQKKWDEWDDEENSDLFSATTLRSLPDLLSNSRT